MSSTLRTSSVLVKPKTTTEPDQQASMLHMAADPHRPVVKGLTWILENRIDPSTGRLFTRRGLARAAGLKAEVHVQQILAGYQKKIETETAVALARAGNVKVHWLLTHEGSREPFEEQDQPDRAVLYDDQYPLREDAARAARALKTISERAIEHVQSIRYKHEAASQITADEWLDKMRQAQKDIDRGLLSAKAPARELPRDDELESEPPVNRLLDKPKPKKRPRKR